MKITASVQHYLRSAWYYQKKADFLNEKIMVLRAKATKITTSYQDAPSFGGFEDHRQQVIAEMVDTEWNEALAYARGEEFAVVIVGSG